MICGVCGSEFGRRARECAECAARAVAPQPVQSQHLQQTIELSGIIAQARGRFDSDAPAPAIRELSTPAIAPPPRVASRPAPTWHLVTPDGLRHPIRSATAIGRSPMLTAGRPRYDLLALADATKSLSKTHALIRPYAEYCTVEDLGSMNGVLIRGVDGVESQVDPGESVLVEPGAVLQFGGFLAGVVRD